MDASVYQRKKFLTDYFYLQRREVPPRFDPILDRFVRPVIGQQDFVLEEEDAGVAVIPFGAFNIADIPPGFPFIVANRGSQLTRCAWP